MLTNVAVVLLPRVAPFELGVVCEVFGIDRSRRGRPGLRLRASAPSGRVSRCTTRSGFTITAPHDLDRLRRAPTSSPSRPSPRPRLPPQELLQALRDAVDRGAGCSASAPAPFVLGRRRPARRAPVHHPLAVRRRARRAASRWPTVDPDVLYVEDGTVLTSAGTAAGIDACLHLVRPEPAPRSPPHIARRMVVPPHRDGGQASTSRRRCRSVRRRHPAAGARLGASSTSSEDLSVAALARARDDVRRAPSPVASAPRPAHAVHGSPGSGSCWPGGCWRPRPTSVEHDRDPLRASAPPPSCGTTSAASSAPPRRHTGAASAPSPHSPPAGRVRRRAFPAAAGTAAPPHEGDHR